MLTDRIAQALALAVKAHKGQYRKGTTIPYISHPMAVAAIALEHGANEDQAMAALLHDAIEDGGVEYAKEIQEQFGDEVLAIVEGCTDGVPDASGYKGSWKMRKERYLAHLQSASVDVILVSSSDKLHNARSIVEDQLKTGNEVFTRFSATKEQTLWYYSSLAEIFERKNSPIAPALLETVQTMKRLAG